MSTSVYDIPVKTIQGTDTTLNQYQGKVLLLVNVASKCGLTPQYEGLQKLYDDKKAEENGKRDSERYIQQQLEAKKYVETSKLARLVQESQKEKIFPSYISRRKKYH